MQWCGREGAHLWHAEAYSRHVTRTHATRKRARVSSSISIVRANTPIRGVLLRALSGDNDDPLATLNTSLTGSVASTSDIELLRAARIIRLFRLVKLLRILRASRIFARWEAKFAIDYNALELIKCVASPHTVPALLFPIALDSLISECAVCAAGASPRCWPPRTGLPASGHSRLRSSPSRSSTRGSAHSSTAHR